MFKVSSDFRGGKSNLIDMTYNSDLISSMNLGHGKKCINAELEVPGFNGYDIRCIYVFGTS